MDFSRFRRIFSEIRRVPSVRRHRIEKIKKYIKDESYENEDKLKLAVSRLLREIGKVS